MKEPHEILEIITQIKNNQSAIMQSIAKWEKENKKNQELAVLELEKPESEQDFNTINKKNTAYHYAIDSYHIDMVKNEAIIEWLNWVLDIK